MHKKSLSKKKPKEKSLSLHPLKPEEAIKIFLQADPKGYKEWLKKEGLKEC